LHFFTNFSVLSIFNFKICISRSKLSARSKKNCKGAVLSYCRLGGVSWVRCAISTCCNPFAVSYLSCSARFRLFNS
jgi:hypothetical protein